MKNSTLFYIAGISVLCFTTLMACQESPEDKEIRELMAKAKSESNKMPTTYISVPTTDIKLEKETSLEKEPSLKRIAGKPNFDVYQLDIKNSTEESYIIVANIDAIAIIRR